ncbi:MAG TPA: bifunctional UDP-3-O-[3-hydroxymyristoyl] N-acetylglucosamine deacetylase/3-hydroxyacyl-ACP dehydratase [Gemmatimonadales bacterium]|nr:bifunctional UDP-3-O-[3-hydroxymyristoyl] N-acetylglucosamine deacetylase/3-hydroxyacyl-ACP dehydratase [Gemmatimonadales bacterium]
MPRHTLAHAVDVRGIGLHTGAETTVRLAPGTPGGGIQFRRTDLVGSPVIPARTGEVQATERRTGLGSDEAGVQTVEHLLAALHAAGLDDVLIEIDGPEPPILDGSFTPWVNAIAEAGLAARDGDPAVLRVVEPFTVAEGNARYVVAPHAGFRVTSTIHWDHPLIGQQTAAVDVTPEAFGREIAPARTFGFAHEVEALRGKGLLQGATQEMAVVLGDDAIIAGGPLRWPDEFVRHKIGDIIGDLALLGARIEAHVIADRPSHLGNLALARALARHGRRTDPTRLEIERIMKALPHRYPFLLVDRVIEIEPEKRIVAIKNVTMNEPFFQGHFPGHPIMPGVLIVEAMAQAGGMLLMDHFEDPDSKVVYFMAIDGVRFRRPVKPGDQLRFELTMLNFRGRRCQMRGEAYVDGQRVCEAEMMAQVVDK